MCVYVWLHIYGYVCCSTNGGGGSVCLRACALRLVNVCMYVCMYVPNKLTFNNANELLGGVEGSSERVEAQSPGQRYPLLGLTVNGAQSITDSLT